MPSKIIITANQSTERGAISFNELKNWIKTGQIFKHLFRYEESLLLAYDLRLQTKPFAVALLARLLARKKSIMQDQRGIYQKITFSLLIVLFFKMARDFLKKNRLLKDISKKLEDLEHYDVAKKLKSRGRVVYLRTDHFFGVQSGGSVGHIAGVINQLDNSLFLTSDFIPTVRTNIETHQIFPDSSFRDFKELPALHYNHIFYDKAIEWIGNSKPSFIYQRYSVNNFSGVQLANHFQIPLVLEYNGSEIWVNRWWGTTSKYEKQIEQIERLNLQKSDLIVVVSQSLESELIAKGISKDKILVNPNGVDPEMYSPHVDGSEIRKHYGLEDKIVLGFIGTFDRWHGAEILAESYGKLMKEFPEYKEKVRLLLIGNGPTMSQVKQILSQYEVLEFCTLTYQIPQVKGPSHLAACDILVSPHVPNPDGSPFFGSPTKLFEYMAMGKGIVASDLNQIGEVLQHNKSAWLVKPADPISLKLGLKELINDESKRLNLGRIARKEVLLKFTWKAHTERILNKIKEIYL